MRPIADEIVNDDFTSGFFCLVFQAIHQRHINSLGHSSILLLVT